MKKLVLGGARSGKSRYAESLALNHSNVTYIATAVAIDDEIKQRIARHRSERPAHWVTLEAPEKLANALAKCNTDSNWVVIDCLTFWVNNCLFDSIDKWKTEKEKFLDVVSDFKGQLIMVSNETGLGIIPQGELTRQFVDETGWLHQDLASLSDTVVLMVAGIPTTIKNT